MDLNGHNTAPKTTPEESERATILQVDASMIVGVLFFLTLTSFIIIPGGKLFEAFGKALVGIVTLSIVIPFIASALIIMGFKNLKVAKWATAVGFVYLALNLSTIVILNFYGIMPAKSAEERCAKNPGYYNVTHPWQCSKFSPGS